MRRPRRPDIRPQAAYPTLAEFRRNRRDFLRRLGLGTMGLGLAGSVFTACPWEGTSQGIVAGPDYYDVRMPESGFTGLYILPHHYLQCACSFITYEFTLVEFFHTQTDAGLEVLGQVLAETTCEEFQDDQRRSEIEAALRAALEARWRASYEAGESPVPEGQEVIESCALLVETCEDQGGIDGDQPSPSYP